MGYYGSVSLWCCRKLHTASRKKKNKKNSKEWNTNKSRAKSNVWNTVNVVLFLRFALLELAALYVFSLSSVMSLPSCAVLCRRLKRMWESLSGPTCLRAQPQPFDMALQPPALWLSHRLPSTTLQRELMARRLPCFSSGERQPPPRFPRARAARKQFVRRARGGSRWQQEACSLFCRGDKWVASTLLWGRTKGMMEKVPRPMLWVVSAAHF